MKKHRFIADVSVSGTGLDVSALRTLAQSDPKAWAERICGPSGVIAKEDLKLSDIHDLKGLFYGISDLQVPVTMETPEGSKREIMSSAFPLLTGGLVVKGLNAAYEAVPTIGEQLVTDFEDNKKVTTIAAIHALDKSIDTVAEGQPFPEISAGEEKVEIKNKRNGRTLSLSMEVIEENNIADFSMRVNALGEIAADWTEEQTLDRVCDRYGSRTTSAGEPYVYRPAGAGVAIYNSTAANPGARAANGTRVVNNALVDYTDLDAARTLLAAMKNNRGKRIQVWQNSSAILLVPDALVGVASRILNSEMLPGSVNENNSWGPRGQYRPTLLSSPKLDDISTSAWYLGNFKKQFMRKWKLRFEYAVLTGDTAAFLEKRIAGQWRIAWDMEVGAVDYVYVVQNLAGTTYVP